MQARPVRSGAMARIVFSLLCLWLTGTALAQPQWPYIRDSDGDGWNEVRGDCNDRNPTIYPGATEICGDGIDQNCNGSDLACSADNDGDGYTSPSDCNDNNPAIHPGAVETCNAVDDDCDSQVDEGVKLTFYRDQDGDGYGNAGSTTQACSVPSGYVSNSTDCNDALASVNPGALEVCDFVDNDCDAQVDEGVAPQTWYLDADGDGFGNASVSSQACSAPTGYVSNGNDCDDALASVNPGASEECDSLDNDCDGQVDEGVPALTYYVDADADGYGDSSSSSVACHPLPGYALQSGDCDDGNAAIHPDVVELCDGLDNNCDGNADEGLSLVLYYQDMDGDGAGNEEERLESCAAVAGYVTVGGDCDDSNAAVNPSAAEQCDGLDNNCDGNADEGLSFVLYFQDADGDGAGNEEERVEACAAPVGFVTVGGDCDDSNAAINPSSPELCDGIDNNCDGAADNGLTFVVYYQDADGDGAGNDEERVEACTAPVGYVSVGGDCDDSNPALNPSTAELCDGIDNDCDGSVDDGLTFTTYYPDADGDGYGVAAGSTTACSAPAGFATASGDCNDASAAINPGAAEVCDSVDNNCDGSADEGLPVVLYYQDADGDGFGNEEERVEACTTPAGYVTVAGDCDDSNAAVRPGVGEVCDTIDNDCDGSVDEGVQNTFYRDADQDGYGGSVSVSACSAPSGYVSSGGDCNDSAANVNPGATELCDGLDNDCNGQVDDNVTLLTQYADADGDGFGAGAPVEDCRALDGYVTVNGDCDDTNAQMTPGRVESCDGLDNNCDGTVDEGVTTAYYLDADHDGYGSTTTVEACSQPNGYTSLAGDCDDSDDKVNPGSVEICDFEDNNCSGTIDEGLPQAPQYLDADGDGYGAGAAALSSCRTPSGYSSNALDCDDSNASINPDGTEECDGFDNNCDGSVDEGLGSTWYQDQDGDGFGGPNGLVSCIQPSGYVGTSTDCNDLDASVKPGAAELCDEIDNDCDGQVDDGVTSVTQYPDMDGDGYGSPSGSPVQNCAPVEGYSLNNLDCDDSRAQVNPAAEELCDQLDNDCNGAADDGLVTIAQFEDVDGDGFGAGDAVQSCSLLAGYTETPGDCDDTDSSVNPAAAEVCDQVDNNCNGATDEGVTSTFYFDGDQDGFGSSATAQACVAPSGYADVSGDCNDNQASVNPAATEICDGLDNDCNDLIDDGLASSTYYPDGDGDGYGFGEGVESCQAIAGYVTNNSDCNDGSSSIHPNAIEVCDSVDNDCDGSVDDGLTLITQYADNDEDGYGAGAPVTRCDVLSGYVLLDGDCADDDAAINPAALEVCDTIDNDCDGQADDGVLSTFYQDTDGDGFGSSSTAQGCSAPEGYVVQSGDCDDSNAQVRPGAPELCDELDNDCDGIVDEGVSLITQYRDQDGDGYGAGAAVQDCALLDGYTTTAGDCNDANGAIKPGANELCDGIDNDCDGQIDDGVTSSLWYLDADHDGFGGTSTVLDCAQPAGYVAVDGDCNDGNAAINPSAAEVCDGADNDCDGSTDEGVKTTFFQDNDNDGFGSSTTVQACTKPSGYATVGGDCNDASATVNPGASETCDDIDNDCDGSIDEGLTTATFYRDADGDGYGVSSNSVTDCAAPSGYVTVSGDCNDNNASIKPNATEVCDSVDNDCDAQVDEGVTTTFYLDGDNDGYGSSTTTQACSKPTGYANVGGDCNDGDAAIKPGAAELCDDVDNDCDGTADEGLATSTYYRDADGDGYGTSSTTVTDCAAPSGYVASSGDCNDSNANIKPGATEICDGADNDCDGSTDEGVTTTFYQDSDNDGFGSSNTTQACSKPSGYATVGGDCDDATAAINPSATEICDGADNDCDTQIDEGVKTTYYQDNDSDGYGSSITTQACTKPSGYATVGGDCNDANAAVKPGAAELCDGLDNDCDSQIDEGVTTATYYQDADNDGYGGSTSVVDCAPPSGYVSVGGDCNDANATINPAASEVCDGADNDCDGSTDEGVKTTYYQDSDNDGYGSSSTTQACSKPSGYATIGGDCNDADAAIKPGATELCDDVDNDCDGTADEGLATSTYYRDADGDGYGVSSTTVTDCAAPSGYVATSGDCNDNNASIKPNATEVCDGVDNDCDSQVDEGVTTTYYQDSDNDGYGSSSTTQACSKPAGYATVGGDCNDANAAIKPGAAEVCDDVDNDCDGTADEGLATSTYYRDADGDGYGTSSTTVTDCAAPSGYVATSGDCNDSNANIKPGATETCDGVDNDCDSQVDEGVTTTYYQDSDNDGYGSSTTTQACSKPSGYATVGGDCDDAAAAINPAATEVCDGADNDCDTQIDEGVKTTYYQDNDSDGYGSSITTQACSKPSGYATVGGDCNDANAAVKPGAAELCDGLDNDCDSQIDEGVTTATYYRDADNDGYGGSTTVVDCAPPSGYVAVGGDCNDANSAINPAAAEVCDSVDNDCDGSTDEGVKTTYYQDNDNDGYGSSSTTQACSKPTGYATVGGDCNDANAAIKPGATELCDDVDNDCDGTADEGLATSTYYRDADGDGYGTSSTTVTDCSAPAGYVATSGDCNDSNANVKPGATEICDSVDNNCNGSVDEGVTTTFYQDSDNDGYGSSTTTQACSKPTGYATVGGDCNDTNAAINPSATEVCDGADNDCDSQVDEGVKTTYYQDNDGDGYGSTSTTQACSKPTGYATVGGDCNDANAAIKPGATELCDDVDNDCDGTADEGLATATYYRDADGDGYGVSSTTVTDCAAPSGYVATSGDCNDSNANIKPGATETCDGVDNNCNGSVDEGVTTTYYQDSDNDGYGSSTTTQACSKPTGYATVGGDCNDTNAAINPSATEVCDGADNDCDSQVDEGVKTTYYQDNDGDGYGSTSTTQACSKPTGYATVGGDCNDANAAIKPGATELCDDVDNDCDGTADEGLATATYYRDADGDGYGVSSTTVTDCAAPSGYVATSGDCNDSNANIKPGATETCDGVDNNCNGSVDEGVTSTWYLDNDADGYGQTASSTQACTKPTGYASVGGDCNDSNAAIKPGAAEICDGLDNDCDSQIDEGVSASTWYRDIDGDGYGNSSSSTTACTQPSGYVATGGDCNDNNAAIKPGATEICDGLDNDCDSQIDEGVSGSTWYRDIDGDGYGNSSSTTTACTQPSGYVATGGDCNDNNAAIKPGATETCDSVDNDCDGSTDEGFDADNDGYTTCGGDCNDSNASIKPSATEICDGVDNDCDSQIDEGVKITYYRDVDGDGYGISGTTTQACSKPTGYATVAGDCNDNNASIKPGATELCDDIDNDCDSQIDEGLTNATYYRDADGDGYGTTATTVTDCAAPSGYVATSGDCNDSNASIKPGATEVCDNVDNDCDSQIDEGVSYTYYPDFDGDGYGETVSSTKSCSATPPSGYITTGGDCNDDMWSINPLAKEICNGHDDDCDGLKDQADTWGDNTGDLATINTNCATYDRKIGGEITQVVSIYTKSGQTTTDTFAEPLFVGGHTPGATKPVSTWPANCTYFDKSYMYGPTADGSTTASRSVLLCFSKGTDLNGLDEVYAQMTVNGVAINGVLDNETDSDPSTLDSVYYSAAESGTGYEVWYLSDSFTTTGKIGPISYTSTMEFHDARVIVYTTP